MPREPLDIKPGTHITVDNAWQLHKYDNDEFVIQIGDDEKWWVATHDGYGRKVTIIRAA